MKIVFESLKEIKEFILMVDIYQFCENQKERDSVGYTFTNKYMNTETQEQYVVTKPEESRVIQKGNIIIITPYYKQISWLFQTLLLSIVDIKELDPEILLKGFRTCCESYFVINPDHMAKELMLYIIDGLKRFEDIHRNQDLLSV